jgi:hypothetical protein
MYSEEKLMTHSLGNSIDIVQFKNKWACSQVLICLTQKCFFVRYFNTSDPKTVVY